ncbi:MAG TPA: EF-P lysine aminoacylase EpmA [Candidatus Latescibacteria bacterium]|nr:EF-P lysine aminoacylase EpmA [Candidatus Latescibacterota bacterium]HOS65361.1 EF-P lysine aminoacylase EpmA [Candidatus Latescibacterota bacterium]HOT37870.1 EF-P lysine aminoacylase EpmA [Candidatus Latescibacterota bacterium]
MSTRSTKPTTWRRIAEDASLRRSLLLRCEALRAVREWFWARGFVEIDAPVLAPWVGMEPHLVPLETRMSDGKRALRVFHQTSPEYALKKLLTAGIPDCFALGHVFRDGEVSPMHNPEFTLLEWYRRGADYTALMDDTACLTAELAVKLCGAPIIQVGGKQIDLTPPWERITVAEAMQRWAGVDIEANVEDEAFRAAAREAGNDWVTNEPWEDLFFKLFLTHVEPRLGWPKPVILCEYPVRFAALARRSLENSLVAERFEAYIAGVELCNGYSELTDPVEQRERLESEQRQRAALGAEVLPVDEDFLDALGGGFPVCAGNALGVDRLVMLMAGETDIARVTWFPFSVMAEWAERHGR